MAPIVLYHFPPSAPSRGALLAARLVGVPVEINEVNLFEKQQLDNKFVAINPQHCVPTLDDNGFVLWESRAISTYLANKYGKDDRIYPQDPDQRALVDQRLYFDIGTLYPKIRAICYPVIFLGETRVSEEKRVDLNKAIDLLEIFLRDGSWMAGDHATLADVAIISSLSSILEVGWDISKYPKVKEWVKRCEDSLPGFEENLAGAKAFGNVVKSKLTETLN